MSERNAIKIFPEDQLLFTLAKPDLGDFIFLVRQGKVVRWTPETVNSALTAIHNKRNNQGVDGGVFKAYNEDIYAAAKCLDPAKMKEVIETYPEMVVQGDEIRDLPDEMIVTAAMYMTQAIW